MVKAKKWTMVICAVTTVSITISACGLKEKTTEGDLGADKSLGKPYESFGPILPEGAVAERVATGAEWGEGPLWIDEEQVLIWSDIPGDRILAYSPDSKTQFVWSEDVHYANGRAIHPEFGIVQASHGLRAIQAGDYIQSKNNNMDIIADRYGDNKLNSPNDIAVHPDGSIWFTDPPYGINQPDEGYPGEQEYGGSYVFRIDSDGNVEEVATSMNRPNGIAFSPDGSKLYVTDSGSAAEEGPERDILSFNLSEDRSTVDLDSIMLLAKVSPGYPDGIEVDAEGRIWSSSASSIQVFDEFGDKVLKIPVPEKVGNLTFGGTDGSDLYIAAEKSLYRVRTNTTSAFMSRSND